MKKSVKLIIFAVIAAVLVGAYLLVLNMNNNSSEDAETTSAETISIDSFDSSDIKTISVEKDGETFFFEYDGNSWVYGGEPEYPLKQNSVRAIAEALSSLTAVLEIDPEGGELSDYGLDAPALTVCAASTDGSERTYYIGDYNSFNSSYYLKSEGNSTIWMISSSVFDTFDITADVITNNDTPTVIDASKATAVTLPNTAYSYVSADGAWSDGSDRDSDTVSDEAEGVLSELNALTFTELVGYGVDTEDELAKFGLDEANGKQIKVDYYAEQTLEGDESTSDTTIKYDKSFTYIMAVSSDGETVYIKDSESALVYAVDPAKLSKTLSLI